MYLPFGIFLIKFMSKMKNYSFFFFLLLSFNCFAQNDDDHAAVIQVVDKMFDAMREGDSSAIRAIFHPNIRMRTIYTDKEGNPQMKEDDEEGFIAAVGKPHDEIWDEKIWSYDVNIDGRLATVWTDYTFYLGERQLHCGINTFELFKGKEGWKITAISDTRRRTNCWTQSADSVGVTAISGMLDNWHKAAATADEDTFLGSMTKDGIYLGTDASERWLRDELKEWSAKYFERDSAWDFKPHSRNIYFSKDSKTAWFEEKLDTWMGECRGSGVVVQTNEGWKIKHYNLAVTISNDKIQDFIKLISKE